MDEKRYAGCTRPTKGKTKQNSSNINIRLNKQKKYRCRER